jgi:DNA adenine methylase
MIARYAKPVLKWAGGKRQLLPELVKRIPQEIETYYEPFVGGGAVFFDLWNQNRFKRAVLSDANSELISLYTVVRDTPNELINRAEYLFGQKPQEGFYYSVRDTVWGLGQTRAESAARTLYLNRAGFNGLYRVNRKGEFNVPWGKREKLTLDTDGIMRASEALQCAELKVADFTEVRSAVPGDFVYFDPPYVPVSATSFAQYQKDGFGMDRTYCLAAVCAELVAGGVPFLMSNSDAPDALRAFAGFKIECVQARRAINSNGAGRGKVGEILVSG